MLLMFFPCCLPLHVFFLDCLDRAVWAQFAKTDLFQASGGMKIIQHLATSFQVIARRYMSIIIDCSQRCLVHAW